MHPLSPQVKLPFLGLPSRVRNKRTRTSERFLCTEDGVRLHGWYVAPTETAPQHCVLFSHGRSGNISSFKTQLLKFSRTHQVAVFAYDYRGYGKSQGKPSENGLYLDADAASDWLCEHKNLEPAEIIVMGRSLGAAVAIELARKDGAKALIVESGFTSFPDVVQYHSHGLLSGKCSESKYDSRSKIGSYLGPIWISHGVDDKLVPCHQGLQLAEAATSQDTHFVRVAGGHKSKPSLEYDQQLSAFFDSLPHKPPSTVERFEGQRDS